jgi:hypothetical protein
MKTLIPYIILLFIFACSNNSEKVKTATVIENASTKSADERPVKKTDTANFCEDRYLIISENYKVQCVTTLDRDTLFKGKDYYSHLILEDFNLDGCSDLVFEDSPRYCGLFEVFLYNRKTKTFDQVKDMLPNQWTFEDTGYYLSYERLKDSCYKAKSYLTKINKLKNIKLNAVYFKTCGSKERIELYSVDKKGKENFVEELPLSDLIRLQGDEQSYLRQYWLKHLPTEAKTKK